MQLKKQQLELDMEQQTGCKLGKEYVKAVYCHPAYLTFIQSTSCEMAGWMKYKVESRLQGEISITSICRWHHPYERKWRGTNEPLDESERGEWKSWLKTKYLKNEDHDIQSHDFMANKQGNNGNSEQFSWAPKSLEMVTAAMKIKYACSLEKSYDQPRQHIKKQWHYFAEKSSHVWMQEWTIKKA